ncbi:hypothetical protein [Thalassospira povalilytica]|uniref:hypothetical protein n=1 Tax=Thalassospira povalilytica TaxID=732237 RepID=UPI001D17DE02|nr:hypothetical protein [Thalassospira povalilytica]MCC4238627.1 hypothetical protein [Thalassospira povalilytica]
MALNALADFPQGLPKGIIANRTGAPDGQPTQPINDDNNLQLQINAPHFLLEIVTTTGLCAFTAASDLIFTFYRF